ncbi:beta-lactamase class A [Chthonomonas calidirosea]|uniref:serine hydrolase n=1 Tax=Chthonomonas calidirosea TaxID=454171 RepID=UPI0006DD4A43|nr:serine hydrolase [Chthonomonas calidirosea]CEK15162.1 beta-lactamase class A [Chthonomonas calidirosea]
MQQVARLVTPDERFWADVAAIEKASTGVLCFAAEDLQTRKVVQHNAEHKCRTASVIKLPILVHVGLEVTEGRRAWEEPLVLTDKEKVPGSGILSQLTAGLQLTLRDVCVLMIVLSDNTATNMIIEHIGGVNPINARMRALGLETTTCFRKVYARDALPNPYGLGVTTPREMLQLLEMIATGSLGSEALCEEFLAILSKQHYRDCIPRYLPEEWRYAGKTGSIDEARNDVGIVTDAVGNRFALALFCQELQVVCWTADNPGEIALAQLAKRLLLE